MSHEAFRAAVDQAKGQSAFARAVGTSQQNIWNWLAAGKPLPAEFVLAAERAGFAKRYELRPDIYPPEEFTEPGDTASGTTASPRKCGDLTPSAAAA